MMPAQAPIPPTQPRRTGQVNDLLPLGDQKAEAAAGGL